MAGPDDSAARRVGMRASDAERDQAVERLKAAFVAGLLVLDEFEVRVGVALASRTRADLAAVTADLPDQAAAAAPSAEHAGPRRNPCVAGGVAIVAVPVFGAILAAALSGSPAAAATIIFCLLIALTAIPVVAAIVRTILLAQARQARRADGQPPQSGSGGSRPALPAARPGKHRRVQSRRPSSLAISMR